MIDQNQMFILEEPTLKKKKKTKFYPIIFLIVFVMILLYSAYNIFKYLGENKQTDEAIKKVQDIVKIEENTSEKSTNNGSLIKEYDIDFQKLKQINSDVVGYLIVPGTDISQTVVKGTDNDYYLHHNFYKQYDVAGWIFADFEDKMDGTDKNIVIYGHNMKTGTMFGTLKNVLTDEWFSNIDNKYITFINENENSLYEIFSIYTVESEDYYRSVNFNKIEFNGFIQKIVARSIYKYDVDVNENDKILTLSTCHTNNKYRVVVHAKKILE